MRCRGYRVVFCAVVTLCIVALYTRMVQERQQHRLPRILCWFLTDPNTLDLAKHVQETWATHCDISLFMSSKQNHTFPTIGLDVPAGYQQLATKSKAAWTYVYNHHLHNADYFVKADTDTFIIIENLKQYMDRRNRDQPEVFGHRLYKTHRGKKFVYASGGSGIVLSKKALQLLIEKGFADKSDDCTLTGNDEDWKTGLCLTRAGVRSVDTRDDQGRFTFMLYEIAWHFGVMEKGAQRQWLAKHGTDVVKAGYNCCSQNPIAFHHVSAVEMRQLYYYIYELKGMRPTIAEHTDDNRFTFFQFS